MQLQRHLTPTSRIYLVPLLVLSAFQQCSVSGLPMQAAELGRTFSDVGDITNAEKNSAELGKLTTGIATDAPERHGGSAEVPFGSPEKKTRFEGPQTNELARKPPPTKDDPAHTPPPTKDDPATHPLTVVQPNPATSVKEIPKNTFEKIKAFFTSSFKRIFGRTGTGETVNQESGTFLSRLSEKFQNLRQPPKFEPHYSHLSIQDGSSEVTFDQFEAASLNTFIHRHADLEKFFKIFTKVDDKKSFTLKFKEAYSQVLTTPTEKIKPYQREGYIQIMGFLLDDHLSAHQGANREVLAQYTLLDMQAKFHAALDEKTRDSAKKLQELLNARFRKTITEEDLVKFLQVPWDKDLFYYDQTYEFNNARLIKAFFAQRSTVFAQNNDKIDYIIETLEASTKSEPFHIGDQLETLSKWINKNDQELNSQQKTALFLLLAEMGYAPRKGESIYKGFPQKARSAIQQMLEEMKAQGKLMSHNSKRLDQISTQVDKQGNLLSTQNGNNAAYNFEVHHAPYSRLDKANSVANTRGK